MFSFISADGSFVILSSLSQALSFFLCTNAISISQEDVFFFLDFFFFFFSELFFLLVACVLENREKNSVRFSDQSFEISECAHFQSWELTEAQLINSCVWCFGC